MRKVIFHKVNHFHRSKPAYHCSLNLPILIYLITFPEHFQCQLKISPAILILNINDEEKVISELLEKNPNETRFFMNINDEEKVLSKFERLFQGKTVFFNNRKLGTAQTI